jgi:metal-responsive CopG/Arc/MetJ family transcriptional regulator
MVVDVTVNLQYKRLITTSFKIDPDLLKELDEFAKKRGMERSEVIRRAIAWYLEAYNRPSVTQRITIYNAGTANRNKSNNDVISTSRIRIR